MTKDQMYAAAALSKQYELLDILRKHVNNLDTLTFNGTQSLSNINDERDTQHSFKIHVNSIG